MTDRPDPEMFRNILKRLDDPSYSIPLTDEGLALINNVKKRDYGDRPKFVYPFDRLREGMHLREAARNLVLSGLEFKSVKELGRFLRNQNRFSSRPKIKRILAEPVEEIGSLPYTEAERDGTFYRLHGILHGQNSPGFRLSQKNRDFMEREIERYRNPPHEDVKTEIGSSSMGICDKDLEMGYSEKLGKRIKSDDGAKGGVASYAALFSRGLPFIVAFYKFWPGDEVELIRAALKDPKYLPILREAIQASELPQPLNYELRKSMAGRSRFDVMHSEEMARYLVGYAGQRGIGTMHAVVGLGHETDVAYLIPRVSV